jgi:Arc/MetJ-type ribon-helix-helix transcriptional regulator
MVRNLVEVKTRIPERAVQFINQLVNRGYYSSVADFARQAILDKLINDFELGISELEPDLIELKSKQKTRRKNESSNEGCT